MSNRPVAYLDTNHLSTLARFPKSPGAPEVLELLATGRLRLGISMLHMLELSDPGFRDRPAVGELLDKCDLAWPIWVMTVIQNEIASAVAAAMGLQRSFQVYFDSMDAAYPSMPIEAATERRYGRLC